MQGRKLTAQEAREMQAIGAVGVVARKEERDKVVRELYKAGCKVDFIADYFSVHQKTIYRALKGDLVLKHTAHCARCGALSKTAYPVGKDGICPREKCQTTDA